MYGGPLQEIIKCMFHSYGRHEGDIDVRLEISCRNSKGI